MKQFTILLAIIVWSTSLVAQDSNAVRNRSYKTFLTTNQGQLATGYLYKIGDTMITLAAEKVRFNPYQQVQVSPSSYRVQDIQEVKCRRSGAIWRGALKGAVAGMAAGVATGFLLGDDESSGGPWNFCILCTTASEKAIISGATGLGLGGITGALIGAFARKRFIIGGQKKAFESMRLKLIEKVGRIPLE